MYKSGRVGQRHGNLKKKKKKELKKDETVGTSGSSNPFQLQPMVKQIYSDDDVPSTGQDP